MNDPTLPLHDLVALTVGYVFLALLAVALLVFILGDVSDRLRLGWHWRRFKHLHPLGWRYQRVKAHLRASDAFNAGPVDPERVRKRWRQERLAGFPDRLLGPAPPGLVRIMDREWARFLVLSRRYR